MRGKILGAGVISGDDGKRYQYTLADIKNLEGKDENWLANCEVDFNVDGDNAKDIFITKDSAQFSSMMQGNSIQSIKVKAYIFIACNFLAFIPFVGFVFAIAGFVSMVMALLSITAVTKYALCRNFIFGWVLDFIGKIIFTIGSVGALFGGIGGSSSAIGAFGATSIIGFIIVLGGLVFYYFYYSNLAKATNEKLFFYAFICDIIGTLTIWFFFLGLAFSFVAFIIELIAWLKFKELKKAEAL